MTSLKNLVLDFYTGVRAHQHGGPRGIFERGDVRQRAPSPARSRRFSRATARAADRGHRPLADRLGPEAAQDAQIARDGDVVERRRDCDRLPRRRRRPPTPIPRGSSRPRSARPARAAHRPRRRPCLVREVRKGRVRAQVSAGSQRPADPEVAVGSIGYPDHSQTIEKSVGSWSSAMRTPEPIGVRNAGRQEDDASGFHRHLIQRCQEPVRVLGVDPSAVGRAVGVLTLSNPAFPIGRASRARSTPRSSRTPSRDVLARERPVGMGVDGQALGRVGTAEHRGTPGRTEPAVRIRGDRGAQERPSSMRERPAPGSSRPLASVTDPIPSSGTSP